MNNKKFQDLDWHDAQLLKLSIDRSNAGTRDEVEMLVCWPDKTIEKVKFFECYAMNATMNFGIIAEEAISTAFISENDDELNSIIHKWESLGVQLGSLDCFRIETSSTASVIKIYAKYFLVEPSENLK